MLKHYICKPNEADTETSIVTVAENYELAVVSMRITGGTTGGDVNFIVYRGGNKMIDIKMSIAANDTVLIDSKDFYEAGDTLKMKASAVGMAIELSADYSPVA